jgi:ComF family protein
MKRIFLNAGRMPQSIVQAARSFFLNAADFFYPPCCLLCKAYLEKSAELVCRHCWASFPRLAQSCVPANILLPAPVWFETSLALFQFSDSIQQLIHYFKYRGFKRLGTEFGRQLALLYNDTLPFTEVDALLPIPLHRVRLRERGYNQSALLAQACAEKTGWPVWSDVVSRTRYTQPQVKMSHDARKRNVMDAFSVQKPDRVHNAHLVLVDDVLTTGSTLNECARALRIAGAQRIDCLTIVRV